MGTCTQYRITQILHAAHGCVQLAGIPCQQESTTTTRDCSSYVAVLSHRSDITDNDELQNAVVTYPAGVRKPWLQQREVAGGC